MFCKSQRVQLQNTHLEDGTIIVWKEFEQSFTMIGIGRGYTEKILRDLLEVVFNATIFTIGLNEVKHNKNAEQIKRELKVRPAHINVSTNRVVINWIFEFCRIAIRSWIN